MKLNLYVDDLITGNDDELQACRDLREVQTILGQAGMKLDKIRFKFKRNFRIGDTGASSCKVLGLKCLSLNDCFTYDTLEIPKGLVITKRIVLSAIARLFDPLGLLSPVIMHAKILF